MELAVQLRAPHRLEALEGVTVHLTEFYDASDLEAQDWIGSIPKQVRQVYVGDEFCVHRLPDPADLEAVLRKATGKGWGVTLLTPPVTDEGLGRCSRLFRFLEHGAPSTEVVVNDWGVLGLLKENHPSLSVAAGRLLNKSFKDPRLGDPEGAAAISEDAQELLNGCTFDTPAFQEKLQEMDVRRFERDLLPHGEPRIESRGAIRTSLYFPFGYISTGRVCWIASFKGPARGRFAPLRSCHASCDGLLLEMGGADSRFRIFEGGNTLFYLYPLSLLGSFMKEPNHDEVRLVYQGLAI